MIELPSFDLQTMYDAETNFNLLMTPERLSKFLIHYEAMKSINNVPGAIVECGVFKGTSLMRFAKLREILGGRFSRKIIAFDVFNDEFPTTEYEADHSQRDYWISTAGGSSISTNQIDELFAYFKIDNYDLVAGDATQTIPKYVDQHLGLKIALLNIDIDFVEPTYAAMKHLYHRVMPGGVILLDNYGGEGSSGLSYHGDTIGIDRFINECQEPIQICQFQFAARPCFIRKALFEAKVSD